MYDVIIIGGGPAGLTAALYAARRNLKTLVLSQDIGGQASTTANIENYPGFDSVDGLELMTKFQKQAEKYGAEVKLEEVQKVERQGDDFVVTSSAESYVGHALILSFGLTHKHLGVPGEEPLIGKGVVFCATCDGPLYKGKRVAVVGGGNSAMDAALLLRKLNATVHLLTKNDELRGERVLIDRVLADGITVKYSVSPTQVLGTDRVTSIIFADQAGQETTLEVDGIFVEIGFTINASLIKDLVELDARKQVIINDDNGTSLPGLFAAGDVTTIDQKQIVISAGEGAKAALAAYQYLQARGLIKKGVKIDWGVKAPSHHETIKP
ncbi:MAG: FAD-dependent oxidoreductase [Candidatus Kerfeldbacteria bacterium]|nr:FAD-dependent oxidoreductase [Candidatus Kerfeldbacteria bacterium]